MKRFLTLIVALFTSAALAQVPIYTRPSANISGTSPTGVTFDASDVFQAEDSLTAFAGGGQGSATAMSATKSYHRFSTVVTAGDSGKLPAATVGQAHFVRNDGAAAMQVFGQATETINGVASATGISQAAGMGVWYICTTAGAWTTSPVSTITATTKFLSPDGAVGTPTYAFSNATSTGLYQGSNQLHISANGAAQARWVSGFGTVSVGEMSLESTIDGGPDVVLTRVAANQLRFGATHADTVTSRSELNKSVTAIPDATPTAVLTVTIPNAAHSGSMLVRITCSLGAGGAIGANEATATNTYVVAFTRTAGVNATAAISAASGAAATAVAGAATVTATAAMSAVSGAVGATNTFTVNATVTRSGGASTNHTCLVYAQLMNANTAGITIA